ncbi:MAG: acyltransferase family protein [Hydrogenovibrio sp.]|uniref:acyltransferase family protein n=1 Tax=Hydrogenovibrio sp. TaxID=2065821 RepID=UPI002870066D|nr:acyltransferase family protein [Hydrogenovibrio sp.]MDR9500091.1 acyltransferase family protein [Hydrogenovibrio sp.]
MKHLPSPVKFREDINGLRAWAVIAVVLFHFQLFHLDGGFVGVDVFFVISGFLMTAIIVNGLEKQKFSLWHFYMARARRILPALMVVIAILLTLGWFWLPTPDYQTLGSQSAYALSFISNIHYWRSAGYFDAVAHEKWLLHTWSLGVEAQFYLLYPIFLVLLWKWRPQINTLIWGVIAAFVASLMLSVFATGWKPVPAFYLLPTRGWELAAGGLAFFIGRYWQPKFDQAWLFWGGWIALVASFVWLNEDYLWPSGWALWPVLATVLIIVSQQTVSIFTRYPVAQWLGDRSYSLYLWHWPLVVALYFAGIETEWAWVLGAVGLSLLLAHLSYQFVEVPTRSFLSVSSMQKEIMVIAVAGLVIGFAAVSVRLFTFDNRLPEAVEKIAGEVNNKYAHVDQCIRLTDKTSEPQNCRFNERLPLGVISIGDSHNYSTFTALGSAAEQFNLDAMHWARSGCPTLIGAKFHGREPGCFEFNKRALERLKDYPSDVAVVLVSRLTRALISGNEDPENRQNKTKIYFDEIIEDGRDPHFRKQFSESLIKTACQLSEQRPVYLVRPIPEMGKNVPKEMAKRAMFGNDDPVKISVDEYHERHGFVWETQDQAAKQCGVQILNPLPYLCDDQYCYGSKNGRPLYFDDDHLSEYGNKFLVPMFEQIFTDPSVTQKP